MPGDHASRRYEPRPGVGASSMGASEPSAAEPRRAASPREPLVEATTGASALPAPRLPVAVVEAPPRVGSGAPVGEKSSSRPRRVAREAEREGAADRVEPRFRARQSPNPVVGVVERSPGSSTVDVSSSREVASPPSLESSRVEPPSVAVSIRRERGLERRGPDGLPSVGEPGARAARASSRSERASVVEEPQPRSTPWSRRPSPVEPAPSITASPARRGPLGSSEAPRRPGPRSPGGRAPEAGPAPVTVTIGRIEIRAPEAPISPVRDRPAPRGFDEFLALRGAGGGS